MRLLLIVLIAIVVAASSGLAYVVPEPEQVIITQFGKPVGDPVSTPGLHFKLPFIQKLHRFDKRFLEWDAQPTELTTKDKRFILVDTYARWRITDPLLYFQRLRDERRAQSRLDDILEGETRNAIAKHRLGITSRGVTRRGLRKGGRSTQKPPKRTRRVKLAPRGHQRRALKLTSGRRRASLFPCLLPPLPFEVPILAIVFFAHPVLVLALV